MKYIFNGQVLAKNYNFIHRETAITVYDSNCENEDCGILALDKFGEVFAFGGGTIVAVVYVIERYLTLHYTIKRFITQHCNIFDINY